MTLKIERMSGKRGTRIRLSGTFRSEHCDQVKAEIERGGPRIALDLEEVDLVDVEGVRSECGSGEAREVRSAGGRFVSSSLEPAGLCRDSHRP
jgi:hypothetical protein